MAQAANMAEETDRRFMAAALRLSRKHAGLTATNPAVGTLIVRDDGNGPVIVGRGVTAIGGRPHAEAEALAEAGERARGATAYATLEPCAHHGRTPPCANALVSAGLARVVGAASDPDPRVAGKGYAILREAGVAVTEGVLAAEATDQLAGYLIRSVRRRPQVTLKLALSLDGMIGRRGEGQIAITGAVSRRQVHLMRSQADVIVVGIGTALADDPDLTVRLAGLEGRSPMRLVLDRTARLDPASRLARTAETVPVLLAVDGEADPARRAGLEARGVKFLATDTYDGRIALPEMLEDLAAQGVMDVMVEGGAETARAFLQDEMVDRLAIFRGAVHLGSGGVASPVDPDHVPAGFRLRREARFGDDHYAEWARDF